MASGTPVVSSRNGGTADYGLEEGNLLAFDVADVPGLARAVERIHHDAQLRDALTRRGLKTVAARTWPAVIGRLLDVVDRVARQRPQHAPATWLQACDGIDFDDADADQVLDAHTRAGVAAAIRVPVAVQSPTGTWVRRWRIVMTRAGDGPVLDLWLPAGAATGLEDWPLYGAVEEMASSPRGAIAALRAASKDAPDTDQKLSAARRLVAALLGDLQLDAAIAVAASLYEVDPANADHAYAYARALTAGGVLTIQHLMGAYAAAVSLGEAAHAVEWLAFPDILARRLIDVMTRFGTS
jgi:hypothetical protein